MNYEEALGLARRLIEENPGNLQEPDNFLLHLGDSYEIARETVDAAVSRYPGLGRHLFKEEIALAGGLHDIGRPLRQDQLFHELRGASYLEQKGLEMGVADSLTDVFRLAQMFRSHYVVAEQFADPENVREREEFEPLDSCLLVPRTWQEAIVVYAELSNVRGERMSIQKRIEDIKQRYAGPGEGNENAALIKAMKKGLDRVFEVCERVQRLRDGTLAEQEIMRYGFL